MKKYQAYLIGFALLTLSACNSAFPENKSVKVEEKPPQTQEKSCTDGTQKPSTQADHSTKTYKIIGE